MTQRAKHGRCDQCKAALPGPYGTPGVSLSRRDNKTLLCSTCGRDEGLTDWARSTTEQQRKRS